MVQIILIGVGAGAAAALLFASIATGSTLSIALVYVAPLPILIASIGWSHWAGLLAALFSTASLSTLISANSTLLYLVSVAVPAWWLGYLAMLARPGEKQGELEWYPIGRLVLWTAALTAGGLVIAYYALDLDRVERTARAALERFFRARMGTPAEAPLDIPGMSDGGAFLDALAAMAMPIAAASGTLSLLVNLWLGGRAVLLSGRLKRPWPVLMAMRFPAATAAATLALTLLSFFPDLGAVGKIATIFTAALLIAYGMLGLAVLHAVTLGVGARPLLLGAVYAIIIMAGWPLLFASALGLADTAFNFRARASRRGPPTLPA